MSDITGKVILDRYHVERLLGRGGMADVYLAFDSQRQTYVAIKLIREDLADDADFIRRFGREAAALARLDHPNVVRFYAAEQDGALSFIVMDYVSGSNLQRRLSQAGGPLPLPETTTLLHQIGPALHYAHTMGFIHRDIKPGNIMLREDGTALLSDFGAAKVLENSTLATLTVGTPAYMSPEQILGRDLQPQSDIYSFGIVLYEMLVGRRPFTGDEQGLTGTGTLSRLREAHLRLDPPTPSQMNLAIPPALDSIVLRALAKDADDRWPNVLSLVDAWDAALGSTGRRGKAAAVAVAPFASSVPTLVGPSTSPSGTAGATSVAGYGGAQPITPTAPPSQLQPAVAVQPPGTGSTPAVAQAGQPKKGPRALWLIVGAVAGLLVLALVAWQVIVPTLAASRPSSPVTDIAASAAALEAASRGSTATAESAAQLALATQARQTATAGAESAVQVVSVANTAVAASEATLQALGAATTATAKANATEQALKLAQATTTAAAIAIEKAATATTQAPPASQTATAPPAATPRPVPTTAPQVAAAPAGPGVVLDFESFGAWKRGDEPYGSFEQTSERKHDGNSAGKLTYAIPSVDKHYVVFTRQPAAPIAGQPKALTLWVYGDGSNHFLNAWIQDSQGEVRQFPFGKVSHSGSWQPMTAQLDTQASWPQSHISGPDNGQLDYPISLLALVLDVTPRAGTSSYSGTVYLDDLSSGATGTPSQGSAAPGSTPAATAVAPAAGGPLAGHIVYTAAEGGTSNVNALDVASRSTRSIFANGRQPDIRGDGRVVVNGIGGGKNDLFTIAVNGTSEQKTGLHPEDSYPHWSPSGESAVFQSNIRDGRDRIYIQWDMSHQEEPKGFRVADTDVYGRSPTWLENWRIAFNGCNYWASGSNCGIWIVDSTGSGEPTRLTDRTADRPTDSANGVLLFSSDATGNWDIYTIPVTGGTARNLTNSPSQDVGATFSPDGGSIAFMSDRDGGWGIWVMNTNGQNPQKLMAVPSGFGAGWAEERLSWGP